MLKTSELLLQSADPFDRACMMVREMDMEIIRLRGLLLWALYQHQGGRSKIWQPIRQQFGIGPRDAMTPDQVADAQLAGGVLVKYNANKVRTKLYKSINKTQQCAA